MNEQFIGIDPSITGTAVTFISPDKSEISTRFFTEVKKFSNIDYSYFLPCVCPKSQRNQGSEWFFEQLTSSIVNHILEYTDAYKCKVVLEGYAFAAKGLVFSIGEFVGLLKHKLRIEHLVNFEIVPPATIKKFIAKGNSSKSDLLYTFLNRQIHIIEKLNPAQVAELRKLMADETLKFDLTKVGSPLGDIMDSIYMALYALESDE